MKIKLLFCSVKLKEKNRIIKENRIERIERNCENNQIGIEINSYS